MNDETGPEALPENKKVFLKIGDMILTNEQHEFLFSNISSKRNSFTNAIERWPGGIVNVVISDDFDKNFMKSIKAAMDHIADNSCVKFKIHKQPPKEQYVRIKKEPRCESPIGWSKLQKNENEQLIGLDGTCERPHIIHLLLHVLGFVHMHSDPSRDDFVKINWKNIEKAATKEFEKVQSHVSMFGTQYDYRSIMHYPSDANAIDKKQRTIIPHEMVSDLGKRHGKKRFLILISNKINNFHRNERRRHNSLEQDVQLQKIRG